MNGDDVGVWGINPGRIQKVERISTEAHVKPTEAAIREVPPKELNEMRPRNGGNFVPNDETSSRRPRSGNGRIADSEIANSLRIEMDFDAMIECETLEEFGDYAFRSVLAVNEG
jgi:hypothetical protein